LCASPAPDRKKKRIRQKKREWPARRRFRGFQEGKRQSNPPVPDPRDSRKEKVEGEKGGKRMWFARRKLLEETGRRWCRKKVKKKNDRQSPEDTRSVRVPPMR